MTRRRQDLGREGEQRAARYLESQGYRIVARNVRADRVEIDLVARRGRVLAFVEVKTRRVASDGDGPGHGLAAEAVDGRKQARLRRGAWAWLDAFPEARRGTSRLRFDVITCLRRNPLPRNDDTAPEEGARWSIEHWTSAF